MTNLFRTKSIESLQTHADEGDKLNKSLGVWDLTAFGVAGILGAGIFSSIGDAAYNGGPAVIFLYFFTAFACALSAFCYAEFASVVPLAGSAYTYAYASFGELCAWIIGWDLLMEYSIGNIAVAISWSQYFTSLCRSYGITIPLYLTQNYRTALPETWQSAPILFGNIHLILDLPALFITALITWIVVIGIHESRILSNVLVCVKIAVILLVISMGIPSIDPTHWVPFAPHGAHGVLRSASAVFFAYIGFDAIAATSEECINPRRDLPLAMMYALIICTVLYALIALVLTGMTDYRNLNVGDPLAFVFGPHGANIPWIARLVDAAAVITLSTVLLVYQVGQPRIWMAMSRDGLLPPIFSSIHPRYKTPWISCLITGLVVMIPTFFMGRQEVTDLASIGTLSAFIIVCGGVLKTNPRGELPRRFQTPYINGRIILPILSCTLLPFIPLAHSTLFEAIPTGIFIILVVAMNLLTVTYALSLIPTLGLLTCSYLISEMGMSNWISFCAWLIVGLAIYFSYGYRKSKLAH